MALYPKKGLQTSVAFQENGKAGVYPVQAWNDEIGTFQFLSTLADGTVIPFGAVVVVPVNGDGIRLPVANDVFIATDGNPKTADIAGITAFGCYTTVQAEGFKKSELDVNVAVKQKGYINASIEDASTVAFGSEVSADLTHLGKVKLAVAGEKVIGKVNKVFPAYKTVEIELA